MSTFYSKIYEKSKILLDKFYHKILQKTTSKEGIFWLEIGYFTNILYIL